MLGLFNYGGTKEEKDPRPCFDISDASFSVAAIREIAFDSHTALNKVREKRGEETRVLDKNQPRRWRLDRLVALQRIQEIAPKVHLARRKSVSRPARGMNARGLLLKT